MCNGLPITNENQGLFSLTHLRIAGVIFIDGPLAGSIFLLIGRHAMTLTKADLAKSLMGKIRLDKPRKEDQQLLFPELDYAVLTRRRATNLVDTLFEIMKKILEKGEHVRISGFGKFQVKFKWARKGRNPQTGEPIILKSRRIASFQYSPKLKDKINQETGKRE
jgi:integration host factor subunit alpha